MHRGEFHDPLTHEFSLNWFYVPINPIVCDRISQIHCPGELKRYDSISVELLSLQWKHFKSNRTPNLVNTIAPCQSSKHKISITSLQKLKIYPERHIFACLCELEMGRCNCNLNTSWIISLRNISSRSCTIIRNCSINWYASSHVGHTNRGVVKVRWLFSWIYFGNKLSVLWGFSFVQGLHQYCRENQWRHWNQNGKLVLGSMLLVDLCVRIGSQKV